MPWGSVLSRFGDCFDSLLCLWLIRAIDDVDNFCCSGLWRNGAIRPVLKHGPRSLTYLRVFGCQTQVRNESECRRDPQGAPSTDLDL